MPHKKLKRHLSVWLLSLLLMTLAGCIHRLEISQGSILTRDDIDRLEIGMNQVQVEYILGSPSLDPSLNPRRWDYVYQLINRKNRTTYKKGYLLFEGDRLVEIHMDAFAE